MGNCGTKPKVLKDSDEGMIPVDRETTSFPVREVAAEKNASNDSNAAVETVDAVAAAAAAAARRSEKGKEIMIEDDDVDDDVEVSKFDKRPSLNHLFQEDKAMEKEVIKQSPPKQEMNNKTKSSPEISKSDSFLQKPSPEILEIHQTPTNDNIETSKLKSPDQDSEANNKYSENWEVKFPEDLDVKDPKLSETKVTEDSKLAKISEVKLPEVKNIPEVSETESTDERLEVSDAKPDQVVKVLESKDSSDELEDEVPELFEVKIPETSLEDNVKDESEVKIVEDSKMEIDQEDVKGTKDKEIVSSEKEVTKDSSTVSTDLGTK